jgi:hypothetical protein
MIFNGVATYTSTQAVITAGQWYNVAFAATNTTGIFYVNGQAFDTVVLGTMNGAPLSFMIGTDPSNNYLGGQLSMVLVYNRQLTTSEMTQNFNAHRGRYGI